MSTKDKLMSGIGYPESISYLGSGPNFTRDSFDTRADMEEALAAGYMDEGHLSYCRADGKHYKVTKTPGGTLKWVVFKGSGSSGGSAGGIGVWKPGQIREMDPGDVPSDYLVIPDNSLESLSAVEADYRVMSTKDPRTGKVIERSYTPELGGSVLDHMFSALRALQTKVALLENTFRSGIVSMTETDTAVTSLIPGPEVEEQEPLWAIDPEDLGEISGASVRVLADHDLIPTSSASLQKDHLDIRGTARKDILEWTSLVEEPGQVMYATLAPRAGATVQVGLAPATGSGGSPVTVDLGRLLPQTKLNLMLVLSRKTTDEDTGTVIGKNYLWVSVTNTSRQEILTGYYNPENPGTLSQREVPLPGPYVYSGLVLDQVSLWQAKFYSREQSFILDSGVPPEKAVTDDFTVRAAHITVRSVKDTTVLESVRPRLLRNELVWVESESKLYILSGPGRQVIPLTGSGSPGENNDNMTDKEIIEALKRAGYVTGAGELDSLRLSPISGITFVHTESGRKFEVGVDSEGNLTGTLAGAGLPADPGPATNSPALRGAVARYNIPGNDVATTDPAKLTGSSRNVIALGDRVRFGSWYVPVPGQTQYNCSHDYIEVVNSGTTGYPLTGAVLVLLRGRIEEVTTAGPGGTPISTKYLGQASFEYYRLSGDIAAGSSYLIRGAKRVDPGSPVAHIKVPSADTELWSGGNLVSLQGCLGFVLLHPTSVYDESGNPTRFVLTPKTVEGKTVYDVPVLRNLVSDNPYFGVSTNPGLIDVVIFGAPPVIFRNGANTGVWGGGSYPLLPNSITKDRFALDPARQAFRSLTSKKETTNFRLDKVMTQSVPLGSDRVAYYHTDSTYPVSKFAPAPRRSGKNVCTDKTDLDPERPNMVTVSFGIDADTTRCFNWVSVGTYPEYVWVRKKGSTDRWTRFESYKSGDGTGVTTNGATPTGPGWTRKSFGPVLTEAVYARISGKMPGTGTPYCSHKCIVWFGPAGAGEKKREFEYLTGRSLPNGNPMPGHHSETQYFTIHDSAHYDPVLYQITDQQGFAWTDYQVWAAAAKELEARIEAEHTEPVGSKKGTFPVIVNTGDMTQNGTRVGEWIDYWEAGRGLFVKYEQMNCVGNNDLGNSADLEALGTGDDPGKSSPYFYHLYYCYELDGSDFTGRGDWTHPLVLSGTYIPSTYYFKSGQFAWISVNSEITDITCSVGFKKPGYNLYTGYTAPSGTQYRIDWSDDNSWCLARTIGGFLMDLTGKTVTVFTHEMPFTVITNDYLGTQIKLGSGSYAAAQMDRSCTYSGQTSKTSLVGSHLNRISYLPDYDNDDNYWFSRLLESRGVRLCIGGHKHSYTATWPVLEGTADFKGASVTLQGGGAVENPFAQYDPSKLFVTIVSEEYWKKLTGRTLSIAGKTYKEVRGASNCYHLLATTNANLGSGKHGVTYFMCQATGYKLKSNKELPSVNQVFSVIVPKTDVANSRPHFSQESPMYACYHYDVPGKKVLIDLYRIVNIKRTLGAKVIEFDENSYSTLPMIAEKLLINLEQDSANQGWGYSNYWLVPEGAGRKDYEFDYTTDQSSDRCWKNLSGKIVKAGETETELSGLYDKEHTLIVEL